MKTLLVVFALCLVAVLGQETYPAEYDNIDVDSLVQDKEKVDKFVTCVLEEKDCTELGGKLKVILLDAFQTSCVKCTDKQKVLIRKAVRFFKEKRPEDWKKTAEKYDPDRTKAEAFNKFMEGN